MKEDNYTLNIVDFNLTIKDALFRLNKLGGTSDLTLFVLNKKKQLVGTITDGDVRRGLLAGITIEEKVVKVMNEQFKYIESYDFSHKNIQDLKNSGIKLLPLLSKSKKLVKIIDLSQKKTILPIDVVIMAGGEGKRLRPLTEIKPKPLLTVGKKPIIEHNIDRLINVGISQLFVTVRYLKDEIIKHFNNHKKDVTIHYVEEKTALGTIGSVGIIKKLQHDYVLVMNSDLLTDIDFEAFFLDFILNDAAMAVATVPYQVTVPYAVMEVNNNNLVSFREKPTFNYYANAGIYLIKKSMIKLIPPDVLFNATDLIETMILKKEKVICFPILGYWMDIGNHEDYIKAQRDINHLKL